MPFQAAKLYLDNEYLIIFFRFQGHSGHFASNSARQTTPMWGQCSKFGCGLGLCQDQTEKSTQFCHGINLSKNFACDWNIFD